MGIRKLKPTNPASRFQTVSTFEELTTSKPYKPLTEGKDTSGGRNNKGRMTVRFRGGGHKRRYRIVDFKRNKPGVPAKVATIEYDPNRSARIALLHYADGEKRYILAPKGLEKGATVMSGERVEPEVGNAMPLATIPLGLEIQFNEFAKIVRNEVQRMVIDDLDPAEAAARMQEQAEALQ